MERYNKTTPYQGKLKGKPLRLTLLDHSCLGIWARFQGLVSLYYRSRILLSTRMSIQISVIQYHQDEKIRVIDQQDLPFYHFSSLLMAAFEDP